MTNCKNCIYYAGLKNDVVQCLVNSKEEMIKQRKIYFKFSPFCKKYKEIKISNNG